MGEVPVAFRSAHPRQPSEPTSSHSPHAASAVVECIVGPAQSGGPGNLACCA